MITVSSLLFMIMIELLAVTTIVSILLATLILVNKQRDKKIAAELIQKVKEDDMRRVEETNKIMLHNFGFEEDAAEEIAVQVGREERRFYQNVINFYLRRDARAFDNLNISFEGAVEPYRSLKPPGVGGASGGAVNESEEIERLNVENKRLSEEISVTMETMGRMLSEYSTMFGEGKDSAQGKDQPAKQAAEQDAKAEDAKEQDQADVEATDSEAVAEEVTSEPEDDTVAEDAEEEIPLVEEMDDLSDLDPRDDDLDKNNGPENPDELLG